MNILAIISIDFTNVIKRNSKKSEIVDKRHVRQVLLSGLRRPLIRLAEEYDKRGLPMDFELNKKKGYLFVACTLPFSFRNEVNIVVPEYIENYIEELVVSKDPVVEKYIQTLYVNKDPLAKEFCKEFDGTTPSVELVTTNVNSKFQKTPLAVTYFEIPVSMMCLAELLMKKKYLTFVVHLSETVSVGYTKMYFIFDGKNYTHVSDKPELHCLGVQMGETSAYSRVYILDLVKSEMMQMKKASKGGISLVSFALKGTSNGEEKSVDLTVEYHSFKRSSSVLEIKEEKKTEKYTNISSENMPSLLREPFLKVWASYEEGIVANKNITSKFFGEGVIIPTDYLTQMSLVANKNIRKPALMNYALPLTLGGTEYGDQTVGTFGKKQ